jgi:hypothetical protein
MQIKKLSAKFNFGLSRKFFYKTGPEIILTILCTTAIYVETFEVVFPTSDEKSRNGAIVYCCYHTSTDFSLYKSDSIKQVNFPRTFLSTPKHD